MFGGRAQSSCYNPASLRAPLIALASQVLFFALEVYGPRRPTARPRLAARALRTLLAAALIVVSGLCKETGEDERCVALGTAKLFQLDG